MSVSDIPPSPILTRQNAFCQHYCTACNSSIPLFLGYNTKLCSSNCYNSIQYHHSLRPPILRREFGWAEEHYCIVCSSAISQSATLEDKICSSNCYNILYHDSQILYSIRYYEYNYKSCKKILYDILPMDPANLILEYHDYNLTKYSNIKLNIIC